MKDKKNNVGRKRHGEELKVKTSITIDPCLVSTAKLFSPNLSEVVSESLRQYFENAENSRPGLIKSLMSQSRKKDKLLARPKSKFTKP